MALAEDVNATGRTALVVGSGPAGFTTAAFLLRNGWRVTMLDFGNWLERADSSDDAPGTLTNDNREKLVNITELNWKYRRGTSESLAPPADAGGVFLRPRGRAPDRRNE